MNRPRPNQDQRAVRKRPAPVDLWRTVRPLPAVEPIAPPFEVGAMLRSLGDPPVGRGPVAAGYFEIVVERAAAVAVALALSAGLMAGEEPDVR